ncbi:ABC transporter substrate-binding protein [Sphaerotilus montanus]|uniref:Peptide/nickel transport system substrate-binding protein n=1 Tax=Sphaerotilus montanus TaxID=522889 RepID=A0A7Y9QUS1_9BURK|nr:ABC transporter substrate-binding protein [Sphaerotilus montanus]NYG31735.1 peptide/nickel transport system substrate-binding protein [Sphaerotilus montanus]NZD56459.1 ABC transporter substrate-binding protein [Sphaerotilus montanus]
MTRTTRRRFLDLASALAVLPAGGLVQAQTRPSAERTLKVVAPWEVMNLDPGRSGPVFARLEIAETLVEVDDQGQLKPGLAQSWSTSPDGKQWRFVPRPRARFHDGSPVTAEAIASSLQRALAQPGVLRSAGIQEVLAREGQVVLRLTRPFSPLPALLAHSSTLVLAPASFAPDGTVRQLIGSGPYQVVEVNAPQSMRTRRFDGHDGPRPVIEQVDYLGVSRGETRGMLATSGQADLVFTHDPVSFARLRQHRQLVLHTLPLPRTVYLKVNAGHRFLSDLRVRRALSLALDRTGMATAILRSPQAAATQLFPPVLSEWHVPGLAPLTRNLDQARALLRDAGWQPASDGWARRSDGQRFQVTLRTFSDRPELPPLATAIQAQFKAIGVDMAVSVTNAGEIPSGHQDGSLELALVARNYALVPDPLGTLLQDFGPNGGDWGAMGWHSAQVSQTLAAMGQTVDPLRRSALRGSIATVLQAELPLIPVAWYQHSATSSHRLRNVSIDPLERSYRISRMGWAG